MQIPEIKFGKLFCQQDEGQGTVASSFESVNEKEYFGYYKELLSAGFTKAEETEMGENTFAVFSKGGDAVFCAYYPSLKEARIVTEPKCEYLNFKDTPIGGRVQPLFTQIDLEDFGESVVVRLSDGRFIVYDGGREFEPDADKLVACLREQSPHEKPIVAAWIMTHPHCDHYRCFVVAHRKYPDAFTVERFIYNFTDTEQKDIERIPTLVKDVEWIRDFEKITREIGSSVYKAHTGQVYNIGGACLEMLSTPDDTLRPLVNDVNSLSIVVKMTIEGQAIMMCADANLPMTGLARRFGSYLKSDILQPSHHMFLGGDVEAYDFVDPRVCVVPSFEDDCFGKISPYQKKCNKENLHLFYNLNVEEFYTGSTGNVVLKLPYTPKANGRKIYLDKIEKYRKSMGAESWFFSDLTTEDDEFLFLNMTVETAEVWADLYFDEVKNIVKSIKISVPPNRTNRVRILDTEAVDADALFYNHHSLKSKGVPEGEKFTVHFTSDIPIVIKGKKSPDYYS